MLRLRRIVVSGLVGRLAAGRVRRLVASPERVVLVARLVRVVERIKLRHWILFRRS